MKRMVFALLSVILCILVVAPVTAYAATYGISDTDITVTVDDTQWYVFTRDNLENNPEMEEVGVSVQQMRSVFDLNDAYMDAFVSYNDGDYIELFVIKRVVDVGAANLSNYTDEEVLDLGKVISEEKDVDDYSVYQNEYKFVKLISRDKGPDNNTYYLCEYITIVNRDVYILKFQSLSEFGAAKSAQIKSIVDSVKFNVDTSIKEDAKRDSDKSVLIGTLVGAAGGAAIGGIFGLINKALSRKKKKPDTNAPDNYALLNGEPYTAPDGFVKPEGYDESAGCVKPEGYIESEGCVRPDEYSKK